MTGSCESGLDQNRKETESKATPSQAKWEVGRAVSGKEIFSSINF